jgi:hypothetical protein
MDYRGMGTATPQHGTPRDVHDLKHTYAQTKGCGDFVRGSPSVARAQGRSVTTHCSAPDVANLIEASNRTAATEGRKIDTMTILKENGITKNLPGSEAKQVLMVGR